MRRSGQWHSSRHADVRSVPITSVLLGGPPGLRADDFAAVIDDARWPSRPVVEGPHADLCRRAAGRELSDEEILASEYAAMARRVIALTGRFATAVDEDGIVAAARACMVTVRSMLERTGDRTPEPVAVAPIAGSACFQLLGGPCQVVGQWLAGAQTVPVHVQPQRVRTPVQRLLAQSALPVRRGGLVQPVSAPEVDTWPVERECHEELRMMTALLGDAAGLTHLDVGSCYGWFVDAMGRLGHCSEGVERDGAASRIGEAVYGLSPGQVTHVGAVDHLTVTPHNWDVVSCFGLFDEFTRGRGSVDTVSLVHLLDRVVSRVLFVDTAPARWARRSGRHRHGDGEAVRAFLERVSGFDRVLDLGPVPLPAGATGAHPRLFACVRDSFPATPNPATPN